MDSRQPLLLAYVFSIVAVLAAVLGSLVVMETATIKVWVPTSRIVANLTINGGTSGHELKTTRIQADVTDTMQGTASTGTVAATYASGQAVFTCSPCSATATPIPDGTTVSTTAGVHYSTNGPAEVSTSHTSVTVAIRAVLTGPQGNTAANTVTVIDKPIANVKVVNPQPITGGADATTGQVVQQSDLDRTQLALTAKIAQDLDAALKAQAEGLGYIADGQPTLNVTSDHKVGDAVATFTMTMTGSLGATAFSLSEADALMRAALNQKVPKGYQLTAAPIQTSYQADKPSANGDVTIKGSAVGVLIPNVTADELKSRIRGKRVDAARHQLELLAPGTTVDINVKPAVPWLPVLQDHISLTIVLQPSAAVG